MLKDIPVVQEQLKKCVRCGLCRSVCPIFREIKNETAAPRGHVFLVEMLRDEEVAPSPEVVKRMNRCLLCESCFVNCPSGIPVPEFVAETRSALADQYASPVKNFVFKRVWSKPGRLRLVSKLMRLYQVTGVESLASRLRLTALLPGDLSKAQAMLMKVPGKTGRDQLKEINPAQGVKKGRVGYFLGCATDLFYPDVALATVEVLTRNGYEVVIPRGIKCCGMPQYANGQIKTAVELARDNVQAFAEWGLTRIITDCASCGSMLKGHKYSDFPEFQKKVIDVTAFLTGLDDLNTDFGPVDPVTVTYHDPCHLVRGQNISAEPRQILRMIPGVTLAEMAEADQCCGGAGTFGLSNFDLSMKILDRKMASIAATKADVVATCCPTCTMQLAFGLKRAGNPAPILHPVQLMAESYRNAAKIQSKGVEK